MNTMMAGRGSWTRGADHAVVSFGLTFGDSAQQIWYRLPGAPTPDVGSALLAAMLLPAMSANLELRTEEPVSAQLAHAVETIQAIYHSWNPTWRIVPVEAPRRAAPAVSGTGVGCFFTGGVDSCYTLLKHRSEITHLVFVHGFDLRLRDHALRRRVSSALHEIAADFGKSLLEVETNLREFSDRMVSWDFYHGAALASVAHLLRGTLSRLYIAASESYAFLPPWGSHPLLDPLWSSEKMEILHDGCEATRVDKTRVIAQSDAALRVLRVCYENPAGAYNCGRCQKCLRTMVNLRIAGALTRCATFDRELDLKAVARLRRQPEYVLRDLEAVRQRGGDPALEKALRDCLTGRYRRGAWRLLTFAAAWSRQFRRRSAGGAAVGSRPAADAAACRPSRGGCPSGDSRPSMTS